MLRSPQLFAHLETAARSLNVMPIITPVRSDVEIETAIIALGREPGSGLSAKDQKFGFITSSLLTSALGLHEAPRQRR